MKQNRYIQDFHTFINEDLLDHTVQKYPDMYYPERDPREDPKYKDFFRWYSDEKKLYIPNSDGTWDFKLNPQKYGRFGTNKPIQIHNNNYDWGSGNKTFSDFGIPPIRELWADLDLGYDSSIQSLLGAPIKAYGTVKFRQLTYLKSLKYTPIATEGMTLYDLPKIKSLRGLPSSIGGTVTIRKCDNIITLTGDLKKVGGDLKLWECNKLLSLLDAPDVGKTYDVRECPSIVSLQTDDDGGSSKLGKHSSQLPKEKRGYYSFDGYRSEKAEIDQEYVVRLWSWLKDSGEQDDLSEIFDFLGNKSPFKNEALLKKYGIYDAFNLYDDTRRHSKDLGWD